MVAKRIPNPQDEVRFLGILPAYTRLDTLRDTRKGVFCRNGLVPKAARLPCKQAPSERYRAGPRNVAPRPSCAAVRLPMQHDGRAPRS
jgi:hypothetical protein